MKPRFRKYLRAALPSLIILPAMTQIASAAIFVDDTAGNAQPTAADNGANTIRADGGTSANPFVNIINGVVFTGDAGETEVVEITAANYTVTNAGILNGTNHDGINSTFGFTLVNSGTIDGNGATSEGVASVGGTTSITNSGTIEGDYDGIYFSTDGGTVTNTGTIAGVVGALSDGIAGQNNVTISNNGYGTISGVESGIDVIDGLTLTNQTNATITGVNSHGVDAGNNATISNSGLIQGGANGVDVGNGATITNATTYSFIFPVAGGSIIGADNGVDAGDGLTLTNEYLGLIQGTAGEGISAGDNATITNYGTITGGQDGIDADLASTIANYGSITGVFDGLRVSPGATITNNAGATITGSEDAIDIVGTGAASSITNAGTLNGGSQSAIDGSGSVETVTNSGLIQGGGSNAIMLRDGSDTLNANYGSRIIGDVNGGADADLDTLNFDGGLTSYLDSASGAYSNSILGEVRRFEVINKTGSGAAFIGVPGNTGYQVVADTLNITGGGLYINGDISAYSVAQTTINAGGAALGGTGLWDADIQLTAGSFSAGAIAIDLDATPTNAVGTLDLDGNVTHSSGTFIRHDMIPNGVDDLITHTGGTYALGTNTDIRVSATTNNTVIRNGVYTVIDSDSVITGSYPDMAVQFNSNVNNGDDGFVGSRTWNTGNADTLAVLNRFMYSGFTDGGTNLVFYVNHDFEGLPGLSDNESSLGAALDASVSNSDPLIQDFIAALDYSDLETVQATLGSLVPDGMLAQVSGLASSNYRLHRLAQNHLAMTRSGEAIIETPASTDAKGGVIPATTTSASNRGNVWGTFSYDWKEADFDDTDFDGEDASFTAGVDYRIANDWLVGLMLDGSQGDYDYTGGSSDVDSLRIAVYGTYGQSTGLYADFLVGYGNHDLDADRALGGILSGSSDSSTDADSLQAMLTVGYAMQSGNLKHGPYAGLEYQNVDADGYTQDSILPIDVEGFDFDSFRLLVGYRAEATYGKFTPYASIAYAHEFEDGEIGTTATLPGGERFRVEGGGLDSAVLISIGTGYSFNSNLGMNVGYYGEISTGDGVDSNGGSIGLNYSF